MADLIDDVGLRHDPYDLAVGSAHDSQVGTPAEQTSRLYQRRVLRNCHQVLARGWQKFIHKHPTSSWLSPDIMTNIR
jgi:hypothetical protein